MIRKTDMAVEAFQQGNVKEALKIAKDFKIGLTKEEHKQIVCGYECMVHGDFYKQIGKNPEAETKKGIKVFFEKVYLPSLNRKDTVEEWCPHCEDEVDLPKAFTPHTCPNCKEVILPCNQCEDRFCLSCPLESLKEKKKVAQ
ncbi:hypothetical protein [Peribacillus frigoritolerans]|uniref:hypothetical protein n=1 Tax=Peribacillus frigoritolerans TaxID=450367 RepID=UPI00207934DF|nr:hypothetical protein [Peribacillus frigoritolerans]USK77818.1 hypothetical protein LIT31_26190 [Peribacillus frigoritolerans]